MIIGDIEWYNDRFFFHIGINKENIFLQNLQQKG